MIRKFLASFRAAASDKKGVTAAEYAILAVGVVIVVGAAIVAFDLVNPLQYAGTALTSGQASLNASAR